MAEIREVEQYDGKAAEIATMGVLASQHGKGLGRRVSMRLLSKGRQLVPEEETGKDRLAHGEPVVTAPGLDSLHARGVAVVNLIARRVEDVVPVHLVIHDGCRM